MLALLTTLAAESGDSGGSFLVKPGVGLMVWTLFVFGAALLILRKAAWPRIADALDKRQRAIEESIDTAERTKAEAEGLLEEYRERLKEARTQAEEIVSRANKAGGGGAPGGVRGAPKGGADTGGGDRLARKKGRAGPGARVD